MGGLALASGWRSAQPGKAQLYAAAGGIARRIASAVQRFAFGIGSQPSTYGLLVSAFITPALQQTQPAGRWALWSAFKAHAAGRDLPGAPGEQAFVSAPLQGQVPGALGAGCGEVRRFSGPGGNWRCGLVGRCLCLRGMGGE